MSIALWLSLPKLASMQVDQNDISYLANKLLACDYHNTYLTYNDRELAISVKVKTLSNQFQKKCVGTLNAILTL
jgi:hypothetical protein